MAEQTITELIQQRRRQLMVHSHGYYRMNDSMVTDYTFDRWSVELVALQEQYPKESKEAPLYEYFEDFDGSTGAHLPTHLLPWVGSKWEQLKRFKKCHTS